MVGFRTRMQVLGVVGAVLLAVGTSLIFIKPGWITESVLSGALLFGVGVFFLVVSLSELRNIRKGKVRWDERKEEIQVRAGYRAFQAFVLIASPLFALLGITNTDVSAYAMLGPLFAVVMLTYAVCYYWYGSKM
ncbi:hypothetical protein AKJ37_05675 [candidate division MSBL1 archaeon SCGC-AAA259I09]|uniref:DUF2178 domain-containing protein n=1 Tax=candidate division MSBL1 archaeon SCGC-AAA259I09 TaxID=1698267 RepID=A0A133UQ25_9EURY|nr:hypothetical protein AKJ37_05675 [candidate division MSBL1 archaeon SCGC-AAA259I09]